MDSFFKDIGVSGAVTALALCAVVILGIIVIFVWKYKSDRQLKALEGIRTQLEKGLDANITDKSDMNEKSSEEFSPLGMFGEIDTNNSNEERNTFNIGKSGKIYTEEEIKSLIKD